MIDESTDDTRETNRETTDRAADEGRTTSRRTGPRFAGSVVAGATVLGAGGSAAAASYDTITVPAGETRVIRVGQWGWDAPNLVGDTMENVLVDATASGAEVKVVARGTDWTIRNVVVRGQQTNGDYTIVGQTTAGGTGTVENVWFGDGADREFIYVQHNHAGTIDVRNYYLADCDTGVYASAPSDHGQGEGKGGVVRVENCHLKDVTYSHIILGTDGSFARNCVVDSPNHGDRNVVGFGRWENTRFVYCDIRTGNNAFRSGNTHGSTGTEAVTAVETCRVEAGSNVFTEAGSFSSRDVASNPDLSPPAGVPTSPEAAVGRSSASDGSSDASSTGGSTGGDRRRGGWVHTGDGRRGVLAGALVRPRGVRRRDRRASRLRVRCRRRLRATENVEPGDGVEGSTASGSVEWMSDSYEFSGEVTAFTADAPVKVRIDGEQYDPTALGE